MARKRTNNKLDLWIVVIDEEGVRPPLRACRTQGAYYVCDEYLTVNRNGIYVHPLEEYERVAKENVVVVGFDIKQAHALADIARQYYAAIMDYQRGLSRALARTSLPETRLRDKIRAEHQGRFELRKRLLVERAKKLVEVSDG